MIRGRWAILALLTGLNFLNFIDRAVIAAVLTPMKADLALSNLEAGALNSAFLIGYFLTSPLFGARADKGSRKGLIALGVLVWSTATVGSGLANGFWSLLAARIVVGVGEASYAVLAPTIIDDLTPHDRKGSALSVFYLAIPLGYALGYVFGGVIANHWATHLNPIVVEGYHVSFDWSQLAAHRDPVAIWQHYISFRPMALADWRAAFFVVGGPGIVLALACLLIVEPPRKLLDAKVRLVDGLRELATIPQFRRGVLGYIAYTASVAGFSYWAVDFLLKAFPGQLNIESANFWFGMVLIAAGTIGTLVGGQYANGALRKEHVLPDDPYHTPGNKRAVNRLFRVCSTAMAIAAPLAAVGFFLPGPTAFFAVSFLVEIALFSTTSPVNAAFLRSVPSEMRASAMAASIFSIHLFGDLWSAAALGFLLDSLPLKIAMLSLPLTFALAAYVWSPRSREAH